MPKDNVGKKIDALADLMRELLSREVAPIAPVLPVAPIAPVLSTSTDDHIVISNLALSLGNLDTKVTEKFLDIKNDIKGLSDGTASTLADHEKRMRSVEEFQQNIVGKMSIIIGIAGIAVSIITLWIGKQFGL
jgi:hypothetical protein